jgi:hypothetical protein
MRLRLSPLAIMGFLALGCIDLWLVAVSIDAVTASDAAPIATFEWTGKLASSSGQTPDARPIGAYGQILARPVFFKTRKPFVPPPVAPLVQPTPPRPPPPVNPGLVLGGVAITDGVRKAYLFTMADPQGTWVNEGESFMGWKIASVNSTSTMLQQQDSTIKLELYPH